MLLLRLLVLRLSPFAFLGVCKEQKQKKRMFIILALIGVANFLLATWKIACLKRWESLLYLPLAMFPQWLFYGFAVWLLLRCIWYAWSNRVWRRIFRVSVLVVLLGILTEIHVNSQILNFFVKKF